MKPDPLLTPFQLRHLTLRNRIMSTAHAPSYEEGGHPRDRYRLYHEEKAKGGIGLTIIGGSTNIAPDSPRSLGSSMPAMTASSRGFKSSPMACVRMARR